ncbi:MAG TPA: YdeI/OmpD-associated family protein [Chryseosolibacter sp.]|nr:YdeI/OmpD-associated family protein [Chryseosolibacter sp.]
MPSQNKNPKVDWFFKEASPWQEAYAKLRTIILSCGLTEELKWGVPCYTLNGSNVVLMHGFKEYCAVLFMKGALLSDEKGILVQQTKNVQAARQVRFTAAEDVTGLERSLKAYIKEAMQLEKDGVKVQFKKTTEFAMPDEFKNVLEANKALKKAFYALTPGRQRGYLLHFSSAKQSKTREARIEKSLKQILDGKGLDD